jgi:hypothetical protein
MPYCKLTPRLRYFSLLYIDFDNEKARQITNNKYTNVTAQDCSAQWAQFELLIKKKKELLESQIEEKKKAGLSDDQVEEIKKTFDYFDKDSNGWIDRKELRGCLSALGEESTPKDVDRVLAVICYFENSDLLISNTTTTRITSYLWTNSSNTCTSN